MKRVISLIIALALCVCLVMPVSAEGFNDLKVTLAADSYSVEPGQELKVTMGFENASEYPFGLAAFCAFLRYDSAALSVKKIDVAAPRANVMNSRLDGELRTLYIFASDNRKPGFNTDGAFYTVTFEVKDGVSGITDISVTFDNVTVTDYNSDKLNFSVGFNSPSVAVEIVNDDVASAPSSTAPTTEPSSEAPSSSVSSEEASSTAPSSDKPVSNQSTVAPTSSTSTSTISTPSQAPSKPGSSTSTEFEDVMDTDHNIATDVFDDEGKITSQSESKGNGSKKDPTDDEGGNSDSIVIVVIVCVAAAVIGGAITFIVLTKAKKSKK